MARICCGKVFRRHTKKKEYSNKLNYLHKHTKTRREAKKKSSDFIFHFFFNISHVEKCCRACDEIFSLFFWCVFKINLIMSESKVELYTAGKKEEIINAGWQQSTFFGRETVFEISSGVFFSFVWPNFPSRSRKKGKLQHICIRVFTSKLSFPTTDEFSYKIFSFFPLHFITFRKRRPKKRGKFWNWLCIRLLSLALALPKMREFRGIFRSWRIFPLTTTIAESTRTGADIL